MNDLRLIEAVKTGDYAEAKILIEAGADVNQQDDLGWSPLNFAAGSGNLAVVKLLVEAGADIFRVGRDLRTPYAIALAAGRVEVVRYLAQVEATHPGEKPSRPERKYCKAYYLRDLRRYSGWTESRINWKNAETTAEPFSDEKVVFIHQDTTVTESMWQNENVIFNSVDGSWEAFCSTSLNFRVPTDLDLIAQAETTKHPGNNAI